MVAHPAAENDGSSEGWSSWLRKKLVGSSLEEDDSSRDEQGPDDDDDDEEDGVPRERVALVVHKSEPALQCTLLLNSSKCSLMCCHWSAAIARAGRAERIAAHDTVDATKSLTQRRTALVVCTRAALGWQRFGLAATYVARLLSAPLPSEAAAAASAAKEARSLLRDIQRRVHEVRRSNRRLAKDLSEWVQSAMEASDQEGVRALELT